MYLKKVTSAKFNELDKIKEFTKNLVQLDNLNQKKRILLSASLGWMIFIGYLTWWNGIKSLALDKSFRWDEWFWFGVVPAVVPYIFYFIWKNNSSDQ